MTDQPDRAARAQACVSAAARNGSVVAGQGEYDRVLAAHPDAAELDGLTSGTEGRA